MSKLDRMNRIKKTDAYKDASPVVADWIGEPVTDDNLLHVWDGEFGTLYFTVKTTETLYFIRAFTIGGNYVLSVDNSYEVDHGEVINYDL